MKYEKVLIIDDTYGFENKCRLYEDIVPSLRSERSGIKVVELIKSKNIDKKNEEESV